MPGELGKDVAEQLKPQLENDAAQKLQAQDDDSFDGEVLTALEQALQPEIDSFNQAAPPTGQLQMKKSGGMLKLTRGEQQALGVIPKHRRVLLAEPLEDEPTESFNVSGSPDRLHFTGTAGSLDLPAILRGILRLASGHSFNA